MLTNVKIVNTKAADKPIKLTDAEGLYLDVRPSGARFSTTCSMRPAP